MVTFTLATIAEAKDIAELRKRIWASTYDGIYSEEVLENYNVHSHIKKDEAKILNPKFKVYLIKEEQKKIGYLIFSYEDPSVYKDFNLCLNSLYLLPEYQGRGIGQEGINIVSSYCKTKGINKFYNQCNLHNSKGVAFYKKQGGIIGQQDIGNSDKIEDTIWFEYFL